MPIRKYKPTSPGRRHGSVLTYEEVTTSKPEKSLLRPLKKTGGRNNYGRITARFRGGGHKRKYRVIDFKRDKDGIPAKVATVEYDPNRTCFIALLHYADGEKRYILAPIGLEVGQTILSGPDAEPNPGNAKMLRDIPIGVQVHNVELQPGRGGQMAARRRLGPAHRPRGQVRGPDAALGRAPPRPRDLPRHHRPRREHGPPERQARQSRAPASPGPPSARPRYGHEPGRPPHGWWRRPDRGGSSPLLADRCPREGRPHAAPQSPDRRLHHPPPSQAQVMP